MSEPNRPTREQCELALAFPHMTAEFEGRIVRAYLALLDERESLRKLLDEAGGVVKLMDQIGLQWKHPDGSTVTLEGTQDLLKRIVVARESK